MKTEISHKWRYFRSWSSKTNTQFCKTHDCKSWRVKGDDRRSLVLSLPSMQGPGVVFNFQHIWFRDILAQNRLGKGPVPIHTGLLARRPSYKRV